MTDTPLLSPRLDAVAFRQRIAGLACSQDAATYDPAEFRAAGVDLGVLLARLFGEDLDRLTLWSRIATAIAAACSKSPSGDADAFLSAALEHVKADPAAVAREPRVEAWLASVSAREDAWRRQFTAYLATRGYAVLVHARKAWEEVKRG